MKIYDAIIIGSGQAGTPLSKKLAKKGLKTILIEKDLIGGTCTNIGCTPTKTMIASAKRMYDCRNSKKLGVHLENPQLNLKEVLDRKNEIIKRFRDGAIKGLKKTKNLEILYGTAAFTDKKKIKVTGKNGASEIYTADKIFIDVGCRPSVPEIDGIQNVPYLTSTSIMELDEVPEHLLIIGGGYIGLEFGQMYRRFGSRVTIIDSAKRFLHKEDEDVAECMAGILKDEKIKIIVDCRVQKVIQDDNAIKVKFHQEKKQHTLHCSHILLATGRTPNSDSLDVQKAGISTDEKGFIKVSDQLETSVKDIYAMGDVKGGPEFTHIAYHDHLVVYKNIMEGGEENYHDRLVSYTMFTDPQLGRVGITENEAKRKKLSYRVATLPTEHVARAIETGDTRGMMKAIVDETTGKIFGAAVIGEQGGEVMTVLQMAMYGDVTWQQIRQMPIAHPLFSESLNNLFIQMEKRKRPGK